MPFGIVLLPDEATSAALVRLAAAVAAGHDALMTVGPGAPPHVTLLHVDAVAEDAGRWWRAVSSLIPDVGPARRVRPGGLAVERIASGDYYVPQGGTFVGLDVVADDWLSAAHALVLERAADLGLRPLGRVGAGFRPHVTLAVLRSGEEPRLPADPGAGSFEARPALGRLGPFGTFPEFLERS